MSRADIRIEADLPADFSRLQAAAAAEGFAFLDRLAQRWIQGRYDNDGNATLAAAYVDGALVAIGAQTHDEYNPARTHRRMRHFYVMPHLRCNGVGRTLASALEDHAFKLAPRLCLRATQAASIAFWDAIGFIRVAHPDRSHEKERP
jgi:GNAT superfamily N-acetyltransferase